MQILKFLLPIEKREYFKAQRKKTGQKGSFQLGPIDKDAFKNTKKV